jgi:hypothetical protein
MCYAAKKTRATDMLEKMIIGVLLCIVGIQFVFLKVMWRRVRTAENHARSWKLAAEREMLKSGQWEQDG